MDHFLNPAHSSHYPGFPLNISMSVCFIPADCTTILEERIIMSITHSVNGIVPYVWILSMNIAYGIGRLIVVLTVVV